MPRSNRALLLAPLLLISGCGHQNKITVQRAWVNLNTLVQHDPYTLQADRLEQSAHLIFAPNISQEHIVPISASTPPFNAPQNVGSSLAKVRAQNVSKNLSRYLKQYRHMLTLSSRIPYRLFENSETDDLEDSYHRQLKRHENSLQIAANLQSTTIDRQLLNLELKQAALSTNTGRAFGQPGLDRLHQLDIVKSTILALNTRRAQLQAAVIPTAVKEMVPIRIQMEIAFKAKLKAYKMQQLEQIDKEVQLASSQQMTLLNRLHINLSNSAASKMVPLPSPPPLQLNQGVQWVSRITQIRDSHSQIQSQTEAMIARRRANLMVMAHTDAKLAAQQVAHSLGFVLVPAHSRGATDITQQVLAALKR